ncbi:Stk1 family PASTA domain-containing Ser/Thr kinase [Clostridium chauvoei]|uniref:Stk1 family PASTA domain-containing Ser/Thr kinase n=1 Tax=Clostridium chauvoei TaxID=46867 RepID=UPI001C84624C|nr:Stk1 family PASTA domain-containing Ser/Thr kinase [Clostridium chauvoei]MBX7300578.1 Stk1 family PASTA domain-containing Ser/Thr kinase [Clostridium chauvoei]
MVLGDRYELLEKVGEGGMSEVFKAKCNKLNRFVAVKILKKEFANNEEISQKFKREATAIANLSDTNIVNVLDVGTQDDINYIVMEYVNGKTLKDFIQYNGKLGYATAIKIALQIAKALECAHKNNIIHRDIKPQNILVTEGGGIKVTDFGIAKSTDSSTITNTTSIIGSAHYLSPEQAKGTYIDFRTDLYSLGVVLYEMVTGKLPFEGDSPVTVALKHLQEEPVSPKSLNPSIPDSLNKLILKAMEKTPVKRYQSAKDIIQDLQKIQQNPDVIIGEKPSMDDQHTIVMSPITMDNDKTTQITSLKDEYYDEDDEYDEEDYEDDDEEDGLFKKRKTKENKPKKKNNNKKVIIAIVGILALLAIGVGGFFLTKGSSSKEVEVPNIESKKLDDAKKELDKLGLELEEVGTEKSDKPEGTIIDVNPKVGTKVKKKSKVKVIVSGGEEKLKMPDFRDYEVDNIKQYFDLQGYKNYTITEQFSNSVPKGYFISQSPAAKAEIKKDTKIEVVVSKGPEIKLVDVPNVVGYSEGDGKSTLEGLKLSVSVNYQTTNNKNEDGKVLSQSIKGTKVEEGTSVSITVGKYEEKIIDIAGLGIYINMPVNEAKALLKGAGINVAVSGDGYKVADFTKSVKEGETVTLTTNKKEQENPPKPESGNGEEKPPIGNQ